MVGCATQLAVLCSRPAAASVAIPSASSYCRVLDETKAAAAGKCAMRAEEFVKADRLQHLETKKHQTHQKKRDAEEAWAAAVVAAAVAVSGCIAVIVLAVLVWAILLAPLRPLVFAAALATEVAATGCTASPRPHEAAPRRLRLLLVQY